MGYCENFTAVRALRFGSVRFGTSVRPTPRHAAGVTVFCVGGPALVPKPANRVQGVPVPLLDTAAKSAAHVIGGLGHLLSKLELVIEGT